MNTHTLSATLKDNAKIRLSGHYGFLIGSRLIISCITLAATLLVSSFVSFPLIQTNSKLFLHTFLLHAITILASTFVGVLQVGVALIYLKFACGNTKVSLSDIFYGFQHDLNTVLGISFITAAIATLPSLFSDVFYNIYIITANEAFELISFLGEGILYILCFFINLFLFPCYYLILDFPGKSTGEILRLCFHIMKGNKKKLLYLTLSFLPLQILSVLSIIGGFWVEPYVLMTQALFFFEIMKKENTEK